MEEKLNIEMCKMPEEANCITHGGKFHADEIFATIILSKVLKKVKLARIMTLPEEIDNKFIIYDIGEGKYDHHQIEKNEKRKNKIEFATCGLIWRDFGKEMLKKYKLKEVEIDILYKKIDKDLIQYIDKNDNGQFAVIEPEYKFVGLSNVISVFNPNWNEQKDADECFYEALIIANCYFEHFIKKEISKLQAKDEVEEAIRNSKNGIMILEQFLPWKELLLNSENERAKEINFVIYPSNREGFTVYAVPEAIGKCESRKSFPKEWAGLKDEKLQKVTGVKTAKFCHNACFIMVSGTQEDAVKLAQLANSDN